MRVDLIEFFLGLAHLFLDELLGGSAGVDCAFGLLVDVLAGEFGGDSLCRFGIWSTIGNIKSVRDFVARGVDLDFDLLAHLIDQQFHRLATQALVFIEIVLFHQWLQRTAAGDDLGNAGQFAGQRLFSNRRHYRGRQRRRLDDDQGDRLINVGQAKDDIADGQSDSDRRQQNQPFTLQRDARIFAKFAWSKFNTHFYLSENLFSSGLPPADCRAVARL